ncbi:MAG TPA: hypothetical protein VK989_08275 [Polyangia bacterium]|jgi:hypothetical protein|nr:hypothetical protein [Polyangia bacterium]
MIAAGSLVGLTGLVGVLHMPFAAPLLRQIMPGGICPIMRGTPEQIDRAHAVAATAIRASASTPAPVRPALGFTLDKSTRADLDAWAKRNDVSCKSIAGNETLRRCTDIPASAVGEPEALGALEEATFEFKSSGQLVNVQTMRRHLSGAQAALAAGTLEQAAVAGLGAPSTSAGTPTAAHLSSGQLATFVATHVFTDYRATISATNLAPTGVMVREEYLSVR